MKLRRIMSIILAAVLLATTAVVAANAADTSVADTGAYVNKSLYSSSVYNGEDLGATYTPSATTWKVWSPAATKIQVKLYKTGSDRENGAGVIGTYDLTKGSNDVWSYTKSGDCKNIYYTYLVTAKNALGNVVTNETQDVYSKALGVNGNRSMVVDLDSTDPEGWDSDKHVTFDTKTRSAVWELHIRDFSADPDSGVSEEHQGMYLAFTEGGTTYKNEGNFATCMDYIVENNINTVQLMPFADFDGVDEVYGASEKDRNWGYNPKNYNVPDGSYSTNPYDGNVRINEVKQMIQALHDRGISVVMDVVYNHTAGVDGSCFTKTVPNYYYRMSTQTAGVDGSGQGNELASDKAMVRNYIVQSLKYWATEYHIDGFRFDLMGCMDLTTLTQCRTAMNAIDQNILLYGEPWIGGEGTENPDKAVVSSEDKASQWPSGLGAFSGKWREAASYVNSDTSNAQGWLGNGANSVISVGDRTPTVVSGIKAGLLDGNDPTKTVNYLDCHDNLTLWDKIVGAYTKSGEGKKSITTAANVNSTSQNYIRTLNLGGVLLLTSQGISFMNSGTEFARTKQGQGNSYNSPDSINMLDWKRAGTYKSNVEYFRGLRQINEVYSPFSDDGNSMRGTISFIKQTGSTIGYTIQNTQANINKGEWGKVAVLMNSGDSAASFNISGNWVVVADADKAGVKQLGTASGSYSVPAHSGAILVEQSTFSDKSSDFSYATLTTKHYLGGELYKTETAKYRVGTTYRALKDANLLLNNSITNTEGTPSGKMTGDTTVSYYYTANGKTLANLTVKYVDQNGSKLTPDMVYTLESGDEYSIPVCAIQRYQVDTDKYPANTTGTFTGEAKTITFTYKPLASDSTIVHYYRASNFTTAPLCYAYTDDGEEPLGDWNSTRTSRMKADNALGSNWYTITVPIASCYVMFHTTDSTQGQEPAKNEPGYVAAGEVYIKDHILSITPTIVTSYIDIDTGKKLKNDVVVTEEHLSTDQYTTQGDDSLGTLVEQPANASGFCTAGTTNVVYLYKGGTPMTEPTQATQGPVVVDSYLLGDSNCDGKVNINDVTYIQQYLVTLVLFESSNTRNADVDGSGKVTIKDANFIQRKLVNISVPYKIDEVIEVTAAPQPTQSTQPTETQSTDPQPGDYVTIIFSNNLFWSGTIYCYTFDDDGPLGAGWPGDAMTKYDTNEHGEDRYVVEVPLGCGINFTNGEDQTDDFIFDDPYYNGYYADTRTVTVDGKERHVCGSYHSDDI